MGVIMVGFLHEALDTWPSLMYAANILDCYEEGEYATSDQ
ncbi:hypothetical protein NKDENANG_00636 [Candidatus Entotheonellaceae bacterium PAL068K]